MMSVNARVAGAVDPLLIGLSAAAQDQSNGKELENAQRADSFADVIDFLRDVSGTNIFVNWNELESGTTSVKSIEQYVTSIPGVCGASPASPARAFGCKTLTSGTNCRDSPLTKS